MSLDLIACVGLDSEDALSALRTADFGALLNGLGFADTFPTQLLHWAVIEYLNRAHPKLIGVFGASGIVVAEKLIPDRGACPTATSISSSQTSMRRSALHLSCCAQRGHGAKPLSTQRDFSRRSATLFGESTQVSRADSIDPQWTMFSIANPDDTAAPYFVLPQTCSSVVLDGAPIEEVRFLRDDTANIAWGVEHTTEGALGASWPAADRVPALASNEPVSTVPLAYHIQNSVPQNWFPFQPVKLAGGEEIRLERSALLSLDGPPMIPAPLGRLLAPSSVPPEGRFRVRETEIPREGTRIVRRVRRARDTFGVTHIWVARARSIGAGEGWSGLRWDVAVSTVPTDE